MHRPTHPSKPIRLMVGLLLLKQLENLSDERVVLQFKRNPYYQYFCGYSNYMLDLVNIFFKQNDQEIRGILAKVG
jgi:hypothetical protein